MEIPEAMVCREVLEKEISKLLSEFQKKTGLSVTRVDLGTTTPLANREILVKAVTVRIEL
jgi:hypothetical protein